LVVLVVGVILALLAACAAPAAPATPTTAPATDTRAPAEPSASPASEATLTLPPASPTATEPAATNTPRPTPTAAPSDTPAPTDTEAAATAAATNTTAPVTTGDFSPTQAQVWNTAVVGGDNQTGSCSATANAPYGLVLLTPGEGTLAMHNTVPEDYVLARLGPNTYQYAGPSALGDGTLTLDVVFTSATSLEMTRTFQPSAEPGCTHQHRYTGTFRNNR
jgi:hypothetical protein